jgi:hypothetical protein
MSVAGSAHATVIDFTDLANHRLVVPLTVQSYLEDGFKVSALGTLASLIATSDLNLLQYAGSTAVAGTFGSVIELQRADGGAFNFNSIDLIKWSKLNAGGNSVTFTGTFAGGGTITQSAAIGTAFKFTNTAFAGFTNLKSVTWQEDRNLARDFQFDNINVSAVPEPGSYAMLAAGLGLLAFVSRRKKAA